MLQQLRTFRHIASGQRTAQIMSTTSSFTFDVPTSTELEQARSAIKQNRLTDAEQIYQKILAADPGQIEALRFLANAALARRDPGDAVTLLSRAAAIDRNDVGVLLDLGAAYGAAQRRDEARHVLRHALDVTRGRSTAARLMLASVLEQDDRPDMALIHYFRAIIDAQGQGHWRSDETTEPGLRRMVRHALDYVAQGRRALFEAALQPFRASNAGTLARIDAALAGYLLERNLPADDPRQRASFLYLPSLGVETVFDASTIKGLADFSASVDEFGTALGAMFETPSPEAAPKPDLFSMTALAPGADPATLQGARTVFVCQRGNFMKDVRSRLPELIAALDSLPLMRVGGYGENVSLDELPASTSKAAEYGRSNAICRALVACPGTPPITVNIGGERHVLEPGSAMVCEQSFGIGLENASNKAARVLSMDVWHPALSAVEIQALTALIKAVLQFDALVQNPDQSAA